MMKIIAKMTSGLSAELSAMTFDLVNCNHFIHWMEEGSPFLFQTAMQDHSTQDTQPTE